MRPSAGWLIGALVGLLLLSLLYFFAAGLLSDMGDPIGPVLVGTFFGSLGVAVSLLVALGIVCIRHLRTNQHVSTYSRGWWTVALILGGAVAIPHYWWLYLRPNAPEQPIDPFSPAHATRTLSVGRPAEAVHRQLRTCVEETRGWRIVADHDHTLRVRTPTSWWRGPGEEVTIAVDDNGDTCTITASTRPVVRTKLVDFGKGQRNLDLIVQAVMGQPPTR